MKAVWALFLSASLSAPLLSGEPSWKEQLVQLDKQIQTLSLQIDSYRHKALDAESEAQNQMTSNFPLYIEEIKESENYEELSRNAEKQMKILMEQRENLIKAHAKEIPATSNTK